MLMSLIFAYMARLRTPVSTSHEIVDIHGTSGERRHSGSSERRLVTWSFVVMVVVEASRGWESSRHRETRRGSRKREVCVLVGVGSETPCRNRESGACGHWEPARGVMVVVRVKLVRRAFVHEVALLRDVSLEGCEVSDHVLAAAARRDGEWAGASGREGSCAAGEGAGGSWDREWRSGAGWAEVMMVVVVLERSIFVCVDPWAVLSGMLLEDGSGLGESRKSECSEELHLECGFGVEMNECSNECRLF